MGLLLGVFVIAAVIGVAMVFVAELREERRYNDWRRRYDQDQHNRHANKDWHKHRNWEE